jgi:ABC-2 type transport system permease protein
MIRAFRAEWAKLMRRGAWLGGTGTLVALSVLATVLIFTTAQSGGPAGGGPSGRPGGVGATQLEAPDGLVQTLGFAGLLMGAVTMVFFALNASNEYSNGTLKVVLSREPRRLAVLAGKFVALALFMTLSVLLAFMALAGTATAIAAARGMDISLWWTAEGLRDAAAALGRLLVSCLMRGIIGFTLGLVLRSAAPAIGIGLAYLLIGENLIMLAWTAGKDWLPGQVLAAFTAGGTPSLSYGMASALVALYAAALLLVAGVFFQRRDVAN